MMARRVCLVLGAIVLFGVAPSAAQSRNSPQPANPYKSLFQTRPLEQVARDQRRAVPDAQKKRGIVNGMPFVPLDPGVDPKIFITPPRRR
jgi:hypothetical protein